MAALQINSKRSGENDVKEWIGRLIGAVPHEERVGIELDPFEPHWELEGPNTFVELLEALNGSLPDNSILYFEAGSPDEQIEAFMEARAIPKQSHIAMGTIWPRPKVFHVPATADTLAELASIMEHHAEPELAIHFHVYRNDSVLLEWFDAFSDPLFINGTIPEEKVKVFADKIGKNYLMKAFVD